MPLESLWPKSSLPPAITALKMDSRRNTPNTYSFRQQNRQILGSFLRSLEHLDPWWVSIISPVNGDYSTTLTSILGYEHNVGLEFLVGTGLIKRVSQVTPSYAVVQAEWDRFIVEEKLQEIMETVNRTSVMRSKYYFINYGKKNKLNHRPIDQFDAKHAIKARQLFIINRQQKFYHQVSKTLLASHHAYEKSTCDEEIDDDVSLVSEKEEEGGGNRLSSCFRIPMPLMRLKHLI